MEFSDLAKMDEMRKKDALNETYERFFKDKSPTIKDLW